MDDVKKDVDILKREIRNRVYKRCDSCGQLKRNKELYNYGHHGILCDSCTVEWY